MTREDAYKKAYDHCLHFYTRLSTRLSRLDPHCHRLPHLYPLPPTCTTIHLSSYAHLSYCSVASLNGSDMVNHFLPALDSPNKVTLETIAQEVCIPPLPAAPLRTPPLAAHDRDRSHFTCTTDTRDNIPMVVQHGHVPADREFAAVPGPSLPSPPLTIHGTQGVSVRAPRGRHYPCPSTNVLRPMANQVDPTIM